MNTRLPPVKSELKQFLAIAIPLSAALLLAVVPTVYPDFISKVFIDPDDPGFLEISSLAVQFLLIAAIFQVFDSLQAAADRCLHLHCNTMEPDFGGDWQSAFLLHRIC